MNLIPTTQFPHGKYNFKEFNVLQSMFFPYYDKDINVVISAATSSGKTICAEIAIADCISKGNKAIFLSPLRALTSEKYDDFIESSHYFSNYKVEILTGDFKLTPQKTKSIEQSNLVLMTSEMLDTRTRYINSSEWLSDVKLVVVDEAHLLTTDRGAALEVGLMRFSQYNPNARIILLSATMSNCNDLKVWLTRLNNKNTEIIQTTWRPVDLSIHYIYDNLIHKTDYRIEQVVKLAEILTCPVEDFIIHLTSSNKQTRQWADIRVQGEKQFPGDIENTTTLIFVHGKDEGKKLTEQLTRSGLRAEFHCADLDKKQRKSIEQKFKTKQLDILVATSTLAYGLNLPSRYCIISSTNRGPNPVEALDLQQMAGRSGRFGMYERGDSIIICEPGYKLSTTFYINSILKNSEKLMFHIIAELHSKTFTNQQNCKKWYARSFASVQQNIDLKIDEAFKQLSIYQAILKVNDEFRVTKYGKIARDSYSSPKDIYAWKNAIHKLNTDNTWNNAKIVSQLLTDKVTIFRMDYVPKLIKPMVGNYCPDRAISQEYHAYGSLLFYRIRRGENKYDNYTKQVWDKNFGALLFTLLKDGSRMFQILKRIAFVDNLNCEKQITILHAKMIYSVGPELLDLIAIPGVGELTAKELYKHNIKNPQDIRDNIEKLSEIFDRKQTITKIINGVAKLEQGETEE